MTESDLANFRSQGEALARQYDTYEALPGLHLNGTLTLGENIADVAGLQAAYDAYRASLNGQEAPVIDGLTGDQRFFIAYAQTWSSKMRDEVLRARVATMGTHQACSAPSRCATSMRGTRLQRPTRPAPLPRAGATRPRLVRANTAQIETARDRSRAVCSWAFLP